MLSSLIFVIIASVAAKAATVPFDGKIVNGNDAAIDDYPYQAALTYYGSFKCGGSIIGPKHILTAAHCTDGRTVIGMNIRVGSSLHAKGGQYIHVAKIMQHEEYDNFSYNNDIAILELEEEIVFSDKVRTIKLTETEPKDDTYCDVSGWGSDWEGGVMSERLQHALVPIMPRDICAALYVNYEITKQMICAGFHDGLRDACKGDSGGPLVSNGVQVGVVSWGLGCGRENKPGIYTNVALLRSWIKKMSGI